MTGRLSQIKNQQRYRDKKRKAGLCRACNNKAVPHLTLCEKHRKKMSRYNKIKRKTWRKNK